MSRTSDQFLAFSKRCGCSLCQTITGSCIRCGKGDAPADDDVCASCASHLNAEFRVCGVVPVDSDCFCSLPPHGEDVPHECAAVGCGRTWVSSPLLASDGAA